MKLKTVYQTLENRGDPVQSLEKAGPYSCTWENTWLGDGYYFWDTFIDNAHWWGKVVRKYPDGYLICEAVCDFNYNEECFDLVGDTDHIQLMGDTIKFLEQQKILTDETTVKTVIMYLIKNPHVNFNYSAIRAHGINSKKPSSDYSATLLFEKKKHQYLDYKPPIQICFFRKDSLNLRNYHLVFPDELCEDYLV